MNKIFWNQKNCEKTSISIETAETLQINIFNILCFSTQVLLTMIQKETAWVSENNDQQSNEMNSKKNSWQTASTRKSIISH